jgi:hypothetical protein
MWLKAVQVLLLLCSSTESLAQISETAILSSQSHLNHITENYTELPIMPLVVPGVTTQSGDRTEEWTNKLSGKKIHEGEESNQTVSRPAQSMLQVDAGS